MKRIMRPVFILLAVALVLGLAAVMSEKSGPYRRGGTARTASAAHHLFELVPPGCKSALWLDVRGLHTAPALAGLREKVWTAERLQGIENFRKSTRIDLRNDVEEFIICFDGTQPDWLLVIGCGGFDTAGLVKTFSKWPAVRLQPYNGTDVFELTDPKNHFECIAVLGRHEIAGGSRTAVKELLDQRAAKPSGQAALSAERRALMAMGDGTLARFVTTQLASLPKVPDGPLKEHTTLITLAAAVEGDLTAVLRMRLEFDRPDYAQRGGKFLNGALDLLLGAVQSKGQLPKGLEELMSSLKIEQQGSAVTVSARAPLALLEGLLAQGAVKPRAGMMK